MADPKPKTATPSIPKPAPGDYTSIAAQYARAKAQKDAEDKRKVEQLMQQNGLGKPKEKSAIEVLNERKAGRFKREWIWGLGFFVWLL